MAQANREAVKFQSTPPREERLWNRNIVRKFHYFNPRSHKRSDTFAISTIRLSHISIHAPTRGATAARFFASGSLFISIHASHESSDVGSWI